jgi:hypothetical protein
MNNKTIKKIHTSNNLGKIRNENKREDLENVQETRGIIIKKKPLRFY